jgi:hypothetical protein
MSDSQIHSDSEPPAPALSREPGTYRTADGGIEVIVDVEESASWVEDQFPDEVEYIVAHRPVPALDVERLARALEACWRIKWETEPTKGTVVIFGAYAEDIAREYDALAPERQ